MIGALTLLFCLVVVTLAALVPLALLVVRGETESTLLNSILLVLSCSVAAVLPLGVLGAVREPRSASDPGGPGARVDRQGAPRLWQMIDEIGSRSAGPRVSRLVITDSASVSGWPTRGGLGLSIGLPLLAALTTAQVRSLLAREVLEAAERHNRWMRFLLADRVIDSVARNACGLGVVIRGWQRQYRRACRRAGGHLAGSRSTATLDEWDGLLATVVLAWQEFRGSYLDVHVHDAGVRPPVAEGFRAMITARQGPDVLAGPAGAGGVTWAEQMLVDPGAVEGEVIGHPEFPPGSWQTVIADAGARQWRRRMERLCDELCEEEILEEATPRASLEAQGAFYGLVDRASDSDGVDEPVDSEDRGDGTGDIGELIVFIPPETVCELVDEVLMACGRIRMVDDWTGQLCLIGPDGRFDSSTLVGDAGQGQMHSLIALLESWGADLDAPYPPSEQNLGDDDVVAAIASVRLGRLATVLHDVWFTPSGVLVLRRPKSIRWRWQRRPDERGRIQQMMREMGMDRLRGQEGSIWTSRAEIEEINVRGTGIRIRRRGAGRELRLLKTEVTTEVGSPADAVVEVFPGRVTMGLRRTPVRV
ncbi:hypothetical protein C0Z11_10405 [Acidipropionibacterium jensenii]|nr:hypothetical protein C0Z11_10405 [Acidipropionibacterium jensenii]